MEPFERVRPNACIKPGVPHTDADMYPGEINGNQSWVVQSAQKECDRSNIQSAFKMLKKVPVDSKEFKGIKKYIRTTMKDNKWKWESRLY